MPRLGQWASDPRYQRIIQKISAMGPEQKAILDSAAADAAFGDEAMRKHLWSLRQAATDKARGRGLGLEQRSLDIRKKHADVMYGLKKKGLDFAKDQSRKGTYLALANIPLAGFFGYKQMQRDIGESKLNQALKRKMLGAG